MVWWWNHRDVGHVLPATDGNPAETSRDNMGRILGSRKCGECHADQMTVYQNSGHARTFFLSRDFPGRDKFDGLAVEDPERGHAFKYSNGESGIDVSIPELFGEKTFPLQFAFGSGEHAVTFVTLLPGEGDPLGVEHRVTWFTGHDAAGLTPGQRGLPVHETVEHFGRLIEGHTLQRCFECHTTSGKIVGDKVIDLHANVGCENCHASAASHVAAMETGQGAPNFGFPARPWRDDEQIRICGDCHRSVDNVSKDEIRPDNRKLVRYQPVGIVQSECYRKSDGRLLCSTCHDPHQHAKQQSPREYELHCLKCHTADEHATACPVSAGSGCVRCHMPRVEIHPSISFHDHWIRVRDASDLPSIDAAP